MGFKMDKYELKARIILDQYRRETCSEMLEFPFIIILVIGGMLVGNMNGGLSMAITVAFFSAAAYVCAICWYIGRLTSRIEKNEKAMEELQ